MRTSVKVDRFRRAGTRFSAATLLTLTAALAAGQEKPPAAAVVQEQASATVIEIPVNVIGKDGNPVAGLTAADFELFDDGKKQTVSGLEVIDLSKPPDAAEPVPAAARRLWLMVFDLTFTTPSALGRARDGARRFITDAMTANDLAAVGTLSVDKGWKLLVNFTRDRHQLNYAIDTLGLTGTLGQMGDPLAFVIVPPGPVGSQGGVSAGKHDLTAEVRDLQRMQKVANDDQARGRVVKLLDSLGGIGRVLDAARGRKHILFFSEGFETRLMSGHMAGGDRSTSLSQDLSVAATDTSTPQAMGDAAAHGEVWKVDSDTRYGSSATREVLTAALSQFNRSDVVLDAIDISGLRAEGDVTGAYTAGSGIGKAGTGADALYAMAAATNGDFVRNANDLGPELGKLQQRTGLVYLLIYQPKQLSKPGTFHALKVDVKAPGARVLARSGYYEPRPYRSLSPLERVLAAGDLLTGGAKSNEIRGSFLAIPFATPSDVLQVPVFLEIPGGPLLAGDSGAQAVVQIYIYANDSSGTLVDYLASEMTLDLAMHRSKLEAGGLKYFGTLYVPPGQYGVSALVRNGTTGRTGVFSRSFSAPEIPGGAPLVLPPVFEEKPGGWLMVRGNPRADAPPRPADYPFAVAGESFIPAANPVLSGDVVTPVAVVAYNFGVSEKPAPLEVRAEVVGADGKSQPANVAVSKRSDIERGGGRKVVLDFKSQGLPPGRYALKIAVTDPASKKAGESSSPFEVR